MPTLEELLDQQSKLNQQIAAARKAQRADALAEIRELLARHDIKVEDLSHIPKASKSVNASRRPVAAKYADGNGNTWSGRGLKPRWLTQAISEGRSPEDFAI